MRALAIRKQALGHEHPNTATSLNNLAVLYDHQGLYDEASSYTGEPWRSVSKSGARASQHRH